MAAAELKERRRTGAADVERSYPIPEDTIDVTRALGALSEKQRAAIVLHYFADLRSTWARICRARRGSTPSVPSDSRQLFRSVPST